MDKILDRPTEIETKYFTLKDARKVSYHDVGKPQGIPVLYFHGSPRSLLEAIFIENTEKHGYRIFTLDRLGMRRSDFNPSYFFLKMLILPLTQHIFLITINL